MPDDMYAGVGMAGGGIVAFSGGGHTIPYEESLLGRLTAPIGGFFSRMAEDAVQRSFQEGRIAQDVIPQIIGGYVPPSTLPYSAPTPSAPPAEPAPSASAKPAPTTSGIVRPPVEGIGKPFAAPPPALRGAPPAPTGPTAPTGIASLIPRPDQGAIQKEVAESYGGLKDALKRQDDLLKERGAKLTDRADAQSKLLLAMTGFQMAAEASKPGATFLGSAGAAGSEYAKSRIAANEKFADSMDRLADSRAELDVAEAQLGVTQSDKTYERYNNALKAYSEDQDRVQRLRDAALEREDRRAIYKSQILQGEIAGDVRAIDEALLGLPEDDPRRQELEDQKDSLVNTYNTLGGSSDTSGLAIARIKMQAKTALRNSEPYKTLSGQIQMLEAQYAANPTVELGKKLADARSKQRAMEQSAEDEALSILSGGSMFGAGDLTGGGDISVADAEAEVGD